MRTSKISQEASRLDNALFGSSVTGRTTRSLSRVSNRLTITKTEDGFNTLPNILDIEDAVAQPLKRKRMSKKTLLVQADVQTPDSLSPSPRKERKPARQIKNESGEVETAPPSDWEEMYELVRQMRSAPNGAARNAAVDTMGCDALASVEVSPQVSRYHNLTALMLSSQTKDTTNAIAMGRLKAQLKPYKEGAEPGLTLENILAVEPEKLNELIWSVGFHNNKTKYIKQTAEILRDQHSGDIPDTIEGMMALPGVGPKMAYLCMSAAWGRDEGIGVDVHVHRITNLWGWNGVKPTKGPEETRKSLQAWLPREKWKEINHLLVGFGQTVCLPVGRKCGNCELGKKGLCKSVERAKVTAALKLETTIKDEVSAITAANGEVVVKEEAVESSSSVLNGLPEIHVAVKNEEEDKELVGKTTKRTKKS